MNNKQMAQNRLERLKENYDISSETEKKLALGLENLINLDEQFYKAKAEGKVDTHLEQIRNYAVEQISKTLLLCSPIRKVNSDYLLSVKPEDCSCDFPNYSPDPHGLRTIQGHSTTCPVTQKFVEEWGKRISEAQEPFRKERQS